MHSSTPPQIRVPHLRDSLIVANRGPRRAAFARWGGTVGIAQIATALLHSPQTFGCPILRSPIAKGGMYKPGTPYIDSDVWASRKAQPLPFVLPKSPSSSSAAQRSRRTPIPPAHHNRSNLSTDNVVAVAVACSSPHHPQKPSSRPKAANFAAAVERPPHFAFAVACSFVCHPAGICFCFCRCLFFSCHPSPLPSHFALAVACSPYPTQG